MNTERRTFGYWLAVLGAAGLMFSLWQSWYSFRIPGAVIDQAKQLAPQFGPIGSLIAQGAQIAQQLGTLHATAWQVYHVTPAILLLAAAIVLYRLLSPAGADGLLHPDWGIGLALGSAALALVGGLLSAAGEQAHTSTATTWAPSQPRWPQPPAWSPDETRPPLDTDAPDAHYLN